MIFVTVGTPQQPFDRLIKVIDEFAAQTDEKVIIQAGTTTYEPQHAEYFRWASFQTMERLTQESRIVITQAAAGAIILASRYNKPIIVVPRLSKYGEHFNDHQYQLASALQERGQAVWVEDLTIAGIKEAMDRVLHQEPICSTRENLVMGLKNLLNQWE